MPRKTPLHESFVKIFISLDPEHPKTISDLVRETGFHHNTVRGYLELIEFVQAQPRLILERTGHSYQARLEQRSQNLPGKN